LNDYPSLYLRHVDSAALPEPNKLTISEILYISIVIIKLMTKRYFKSPFFIILLIFIFTFFLWRFIRPLNIYIVHKKFERPMQVSIPEGLDSVSAKECEGCHEEIYAEWKESMHGKAWIDPYFQVDYKYDGSQQICLNCHTPLENQQKNLVLGFKDRDKFNPILKPNTEYDSSLRDEGVTCAVCHIRDGKIVGPFETDNAPHPLIVDTEMTYGIKPCERCHVVIGERWDTFYRIHPCGTVAEITERGQEPDCVGCHMPEVIRPVAVGTEKKKGRKHFFWGGHHPETVKGALKVKYKHEINMDRNTYKFTLTNVGTAHYLPTGTPDRHLTLELKLLDKKGKTIKEKVFKMKRYILWRPFIVDLYDTRLPYEVPKTFVFKFRQDKNNPSSILDVKVRYHLLDEKQRKKIGYKNKEPIQYIIYSKKINL
jgi:hypothetical protein